jgi:hypothetical protein
MDKKDMILYGGLAVVAILVFTNFKAIGALTGRVADVGDALSQTRTVW